MTGFLTALKMVTPAGLGRSSPWYNAGMHDNQLSGVRQRYQQVLAQVGEAAARSGRAAPSVHLVVVSKSQPLEVVRAAILAGATLLGENYAEEAVAKITALPQTAVEWHMIGHVQSRKAVLVAKYFSMLHSLDSLKLARHIDRACGEFGRILPVLLEMNVSGEESKFGFPAWDELHWSDLEPEIEQILAFPHLRVCGLRTMPPFFEDAEKTRPYFQRLRRLQALLMDRFPQVQWTELSMGTSADFITAIEEGATYVRVGQVILGQRPG
jgi:pyridoxal phosphate enzyme (YggS family)